MSSSADAITYSYNDAGMVTQDSHGTGLLSGYNITWGYNNYLQLTSLAANTPTAISQSFTYKNSGLLDVATDGAYNATYSYAANSKLVSQILFKNNTTTRLTTTKTWDFLNRLAETKSTPSGTGELPSVFRYGYNNANQRISCTMGDGSYWIYQYDNLGQVISGNRFWGDGTPVAGQQFNYAFDDIGNRTSSKFGGDATGQNLQSVSYTRNLLNQYSQRTVPGIASVRGIANPSATVTVNSSSPYRKGEYFWKELSVANTGGSVWQALTVQAVNGVNSTTITGNEYIAQTPEAYSYDLDGNLTQDGRWLYYWDAENRLVKMRSATVNGPQQKLEFQYDSMGRRIHKKVWNSWNETMQTGTVVTDILFLYEGWNLIAELDALNSNADIRTYLWGTDMSASRQGAGGVGGLLGEKNSSAVAQFIVYDGNGNVTRLVAGDVGTTSATYEFGPFGESLRISGSYASSNPICFSTKYRDGDTDLYNYGERYYSSQRGRWLSRDPIGEQGGLGLFCFGQNNSINFIDPIGLVLESPPPDVWSQSLAFQRPMGSGVYGYTEVQVSILVDDVNSVECGNCCYAKSSSYVIKIKTYYSKTAGFDTMAHERLHAAVDWDYGSTMAQRAVGCLKKPCLIREPLSKSDCKKRLQSEAGKAAAEIERVLNGYLQDQVHSYIGSHGYKGQPAEDQFESWYRSWFDALIYDLGKREGKLGECRFC